MKMVDMTSPPADMTTSLMDDSGYPRLTLDHVHLKKLGLMEPGDMPEHGATVHLSIIGTVCDISMSGPEGDPIAHVCLKILSAGIEDEGKESEEAEEGEESAYGNRYGDEDEED